MVDRVGTDTMKECREVERLASASGGYVVEGFFHYEGESGWVMHVVYAFFGFFKGIYSRAERFSSKND